MGKINRTHAARGIYEGAAMKALASLLLVAFAAQPSHAQWDELLFSKVHFFSGEELFRKGRDSAFAVGYVSGVADSDVITISLDSRRICIPSGVTNGQIVDVVFKFLDAKPEIRHLSAAHLSREAMRNAWTCPKSNSQ